ncbi:SAM-dependent chlorinase/fluorinase [candidate division KSB1 bacterium]|nr:SAM-dependent chlorinase/fluorinase [candidate division KSB1 bacterium]
MMKKGAKARALVTLLTDFGGNDGYVGIMKGVMLGINPSIKFVDLAHEIPPHQIAAGAYILNSAYPYFPDGTIHVAVIDPGVGSDRSILLCEANDQFFLAPDNGLLKFIFHNHRIDRVIHVTNSCYFLPSVSHTFHGRDIFAPVAAYLSIGHRIENFGEWTSDFKRGNLPVLKMTKNSITGEIVYIDRFGNLITNILPNALDIVPAGAQFWIRIASHQIKGIASCYANGRENEPIALWGSSNSLEIALNQDRADHFLNVNYGDEVCLEWFDDN